MFEYEIKTSIFILDNDTYHLCIYCNDCCSCLIMNTVLYVSYFVIIQALKNSSA